MRTVVFAGLIFAAASGAHAAGLSAALCAPYESAWARVSAGTDVDRLEAVARAIPAQCAVHARALHRIAALKSAEARPTNDASSSSEPPDFSWPAVGADVMDLNDTIAAPLGLTGRQGAYVAFVQPGQPAAEGGLSRGDLVIAANNFTISSAAGFINVVKHVPLGDPLGLVVLRGRQTLVVNLRSTAPPLAIVELRKGEADISANNYAEAVRWIRASADAGIADAQKTMGNFYEFGAGVDQNYSEAMRWYRLAAAQQYSEAQDAIGRLYNNGSGVAQDRQEAMRWYRLAAAQGNADAQYQIGQLYYSGAGVNRSYQEAMRWYQLSAGQGDADAQNDLGVIFSNGQGVRVDQTQAVGWFRLAANQGSAVAQFNLGLEYANGSGVPRDLDQARVWMTKAAASYDAAKTWLKNNPQQ